MDEILEAYEKFGFSNQETYLAAIGNGNLLVRDIFRKLRPQEPDITDVTEEKSNERFLSFARSSSRGIQLEGITNLMASFGKCCHPIPGDEMVGFVTRGRGLTVHRVSCSSLPLLNKESDRIIPVEWNVGRSDLFNVRIKVVGQDQTGILKRMTESISGQKINIASVDMKVRENIATAFFILQVNNLKQLDRVIKKLTNINGIDFVERTAR
jgi:GTP pyrophosphokinase